MKKIFAVLLILALCFVFVGCDDSGEDDESDLSFYIGTWKHEKTELEPYSIVINIEANGVGSIGSNKNTAFTWNREGSDKIKITIDYGDGSVGKETTATVSGENLIWDYSFNVKTANGSHLTVKSVTLQKQK
jgi:uncharacterized lipoprotein YehR (DUF1307 family)